MGEPSNQGEVMQDDVFKLSVPGKRENDYQSAGVPISVFEDPKFDAGRVQRQGILDFGDEGFLLNYLLTHEECSHIISEGERIGFKPIDHGRLEYRSSERILLRCPTLSQVLFRRARPYLEDVLIAGDPAQQHIQGMELTLRGRWTPKGLNEIWRLCRYHPGGHFGPHYDGHFVRNLGERSLKTFMVYLNAGFAGGTTNFIKEGQKLHKDETGKFCGEEENILCRLQPAEGQAIIFNHHRLHEGGKLQDGVKYILRTDVMYARSDGRTFSDSEERAALLLQDAERFEEEQKGTEAAECYRKAFKLWPELAESFGS